MRISDWSSDVCSSDLLNQMARGKMRTAGALGADATIKAARGERQFASGDRIIFLRNERGLGVKNGTLGTVAMASSQRMAVRTDDGREVAFETKDYAHVRSEEHTSELQSLMRTSYAVFSLKQKKPSTTP